MPGAALIAIDKVLVAVLEAASVTLIVKFEAPAEVGEPVITPLDPTRVSPAGKVPAEIDQV